MAVIADIIDGSTIQDTGGYSATRVFLVTGVTGAASGRLLAAINATGIPQVGDAHPAVASIRCSSRNAEAAGADNSTFKVTCQYTTPTYRSGGSGDPAQISIGSVAQDGQTTNDRDGDPIMLGFDYTIGAETITMPAQSGLVSRMYPSPSVSFQRRVTSMSQLVAEARDYVGRVNSTTFNLKGDGSVFIGAGDALCTRIAGVSNDGCATFDVTYDFQVASSTVKKWKADVAYIDQATGLPHAEATDANGGRKTVDIYTEANFNTLGLV